MVKENKKEVKTIQLRVQADGLQISLTVDDIDRVLDDLHTSKVWLNESV
jgi:hypothetical protein